MHCQCMRSAVHKQRINQCMIDLHWFNTRELKMDMHIHFELVRVKSMEIVSIDLTRTSSKWICFGYVWNRDVTVLQFGYAAFMVEICYVRWSILDQSLHWDLFMRDMIYIISVIESFLACGWTIAYHVIKWWTSYPRKPWIVIRE